MSNGIGHNTLNDISKVYLSQVAEQTEADEYLETVSKVKKVENEDDKKRWAVDEAVKGEDTQDRKDAAAERRSGKVGGVKTPKRLSPSKGREYVKGTKASIDWWKNRKKVNEAKVDTGSAAEKATARNKRHTPPGKDSKFDTSVFITRKPGESLDSARTRKRRDAHAAKRGVSESRDKALDNVRAEIIKKHGKGAIYDPKAPKKKVEKPKAKPDTRTVAQKKKDQDHANVMARYGGEANYKAGRGLGS